MKTTLKLAGINKEKRYFTKVIVNHVLIFNIIFFIFAGTCWAQNDTLLVQSLHGPLQNKNSVVKIRADSSAVWMTTNLGWSNLGVYGAASLDLAFKNHLFMLKGILSTMTEYPNGKPESSGFMWITDPVAENITDSRSLHLTTGWLFPGETWTSFTAGLSFTNFTFSNSTVTTNVHNEYNFLFGSYTYTTYDEKWETHEKFCIGIPIDFKIHTMVHHSFGLDFDINADFNNVRTMIGASIGMRIGRISKKPARF